MKFESHDKWLIGYMGALLLTLLFVSLAWGAEVNKYKSMARFYYHRDALHKAQQGVCSDTPQIDDAMIIRDLEISGEKQLDIDKDWMKETYFKN